MSELKYWIAFDRVRRLGTVRFRKLELHFASLEEAWSASRDQFKSAGLDVKTIGSIEKGRKDIDPNAEMDRLEKAGVSAFNWHDPAYPALLKEIPDPPPVLYVKGSIEPQDQRSIAVVGTRRATAYGREAAHALASDLAQSGITVVSGLARGIDTIAHEAALKANGRTLAVMASGADIIYPAENARLSEEIIENGALISEHPLGVRPDAHNFPRRNRLMSGMTLGTLVVEANQKSGALWTVRHAQEQNREVFCIPGNIFSPASLGPNQLIQDGAKLVLNHKDVLEEINLTTISNQVELANQMEMAMSIPESGGDEMMLLKQISYEPIHIDEICRSANLPMNVVNSTLTLLELKGLIKQVAGMQYILTREAAAVYGS